MFDPVSVTTIGQGFALLKAIIENASKKDPQAATALAFISQLQQTMDDLRTKKYELEIQNIELQRKNDEREAWKARTAGVELVQTPGARGFMPDMENLRTSVLRASIKRR